MGRERIEETIDPEQAIDQAMETYLRKGYSEEWIHQRLLSIHIRDDLTAEWQTRGVEKDREYATLTDEITRTWAGMSTRKYKQLKGLKKESLRNNMTYLELVLTMLAVATTAEIPKKEEPDGFAENLEVARSGGEIAGDTRKAIERRTGKPVISSQNAAQLNNVVTGMIESVLSPEGKNALKDDDQ